MRTLNKLFLSIANSSYILPATVIANPRKYPKGAEGFAKDHQNLSNDARAVGNDLRKTMRTAQEIYGG